MRIRTFISIPIPDTTGLEGLVGDVRLTDGAKAAPLSQMHMTIRFIGDVDDRKVPRIERCVAEACAGMEPFGITIAGVGCFPNERRPNIIWAGAEPGDILTGLSERISENLVAANIQFDDKPFRSHVTVGRCRGPVDPTPILGRYRDSVFCEFMCDHIDVMRSDLGPGGAKHSVLRRVDLGP
ncbi:MAG: RNA 2',3'-cyclic phosphodiesterase [Candidatus Methanomethylophilaceae archaeon]|nr:RNA 2',3'-cyclic phosphodiesterase [Candidatus Methanomethylophilaceae archaeon]